MKYVLVVCLLYNSLMYSIPYKHLLMQMPPEHREIRENTFSWSETNDFGKPYTSILGQKDVNNSVNSSGSMKLISQAGRYYLSEDMHISPSQTGVTCLKITTSNVVIDLRGYSIMGNTATGSGMVGIEIANNLANVSIVNGSVLALNGIGIKINSGCNNIFIGNMLISNCTTMGIFLDTITDAYIDDIAINKCDGSNAAALGAIGLKLSTCDRIYVRNSHFDGNQAAATGDAMGVYCTSSSNCEFLNCSATQNKSGSDAGDVVYGFYIVGASNNIILKNCVADKNESQDGKAYGFYITNTNALYMQDCLALGNIAGGSTSTNSCIGFGISGDGACFLENCIATRNTGSQNVYGFWLYQTNFNCLSKCQARNQTTTSISAVDVYGYYTTGGKGNTFSHCVAFGNVSGSHTSSNGVGFGFDGGEQYSNIISCDIRANNGSGGIGYGIWLNDATYCTVRANEIFVNIGDTNGYGIKDDATSSVSCYFENFAYSNGKSNGLIINNYDVILSPNDSYSNFPVQTAYLTDFSTLKQANQYDNVEFLERTITSSL